VQKLPPLFPKTKVQAGMFSNHLPPGARRRCQAALVPARTTQASSRATNQNTTFVATDTGLARVRDQTIHLLRPLNTNQKTNL
jgi:hypothetical protein